MKADAAGVMSWQKRRSITTRFQALTEISWDEFFKEFEQRKLALLFFMKRTACSPRSSAAIPRSGGTGLLASDAAAG